MAQFDIEREALAEPSAWPDRCARCGAAGTTLIPVPKRCAKRTDGFSLPFCPNHLDDWAQVRRRNRIGAAILVAIILATMTLTHALQPLVAKPQEQNEFSRWVATLAFGLFGAIPFGALLACWAKSPIRVIGTLNRMVTIGGVCADFAKRMTNAPGEPEAVVSEAARFEVHPYSPQPVVSLARAGNALAILTVLAVVLGAATGLGGRVIEAEAANWDEADWRYVALGLGIAWAYTLPLFGLRLLFSRLGLFLASLIAAIVLAGFLVGRFAGSLAMPFSFVFAGSPLVLQLFLAQRLIRSWKLRSTAIAVTAAAGSALLFTAVALMAGGTDVGPHRSAMVFGPLFALGGAGLARAMATTPFCATCDGWMVVRRIGTLPRSIRHVRPLVESGQVLALADLAPYEKPALIGDTELKEHHCPECREAGTVVLELSDCVKSGKDGNQPLLKFEGRWEYPGAALPAIEAMFPPPAGT